MLESIKLVVGVMIFLQEVDDLKLVNEIVLRVCFTYQIKYAIISTLCVLVALCWDYWHLLSILTSFVSHLHMRDS